jgi:subtilisin family serine protease
MAGAALVAAASSSPALGVVSQGVFRMGADASWARGITGAATQVAVLDQGFGGLAESIAAGELPPLSSMETRSFDPVHGLEGRDNLGGRTQHGTRMAEIVHDVAPGARLVLVNYDDIGGFVRAVEWIAASGIPVVSHSNSLLGGPFDGSGVLAQAVNGAAARGVLWVNSSGNFGERHWRGVPGPAGTEIPISPRPGETMAFGLGWSGAGAEAVLLVQRLRGDGSWAEVARSDRTRRTPPVAVDGGAWRLVVMRTAGAEVPVDVFSRTVGFGAAAGAVSWRGTAPERYSSRGPTQDGRSKPDLVGPTYVTSNRLFPGTAGTSASTAHVAGAAALIRDERIATGARSDVWALRAEILRRAKRLGDRAATGAGMARVDVVRPRVRLVVPSGRRPVVRVRATDAGTMAAVELRLNGRVMRTRPGPVLAQRIWLRDGRNRIEVRARDLAGNEAVVRRTVTRR